MTKGPLFSQVDGYRLYSRDQYSPLDMAEYVFWTGDEKGITMAIEEFLQDGLVRLLYTRKYLYSIVHSVSKILKSVKIKRLLLTNFHIVFLQRRVYYRETFM